MYLAKPLAALAGARPEIIAKAPHTRHRYVTLGGVLLSTAAMAMVSAAFAVHMALGSTLSWSLAVGCGWGLLILNLDRMLVVGLAGDHSKVRSLAMATPRIVLSLILGTVIATPMTLQIFHREIDTEVVALQAEQSDLYKASLDKDVRFAGLPALADKIASDQAIVASGGASAPGLGALHADVAAKQASYAHEIGVYRDMTGQAQCELNGTCGTHVVGAGTAYKVAKSTADAQMGQVDLAKAALATATANETAAERKAAQEAQGVLAADQSDYNRLAGEKRLLQASFDSTNSHDDGILIRLEAITRLGDLNPMMRAAHLLLEVLFVAIELLPVLMKALMAFSPAGVYDKLAAKRDEVLVTVDEMDLDFLEANHRDDFSHKLSGLGTWRDLEPLPNKVPVRSIEEELGLVSRDPGWFSLVRRGARQQIVEEMA